MSHLETAEAQDAPDVDALAAQLDEHTRRLDKFLALLQPSAPERHNALDKALGEIGAINGILKQIYPQGGYEELSFGWAFNQAVSGGLSHDEDKADMQRKLAEYADANAAFKANEILLKKEVERLEFLMKDMYRRSYVKLMEEGKFPPVKLDDINASVQQAIRAAEAIAPLFDGATYNLAPGAQDYYTSLMNKTLNAQIDPAILQSNAAEQDRLLQKTLAEAHRKAIEHQGTVINSFGLMARHIEDITTAIDRALKLQGPVSREEYEQVVSYYHGVQAQADKLVKLQETEEKLADALRFEKKYRAVRRGLGRFGRAIENLRNEALLKDALIAQRDEAIAAMKRTEKGALYAEVEGLRAEKAEYDILKEKLPQRLVDEKAHQQEIEHWKGMAARAFGRTGALVGGGLLAGGAATALWIGGMKASEEIAFMTTILGSIAIGGFSGYVMNMQKGAGGGIMVGILGGLLTSMMTMMAFMYADMKDDSERRAAEQRQTLQTLMQPEPMGGASFSLAP